MHTSRYANTLQCKHCGKTHGPTEWPLHGDQVAFYIQDEPGRYQVVVHCPHCNQDWYVVWDDNPGPVRKLDY